MSESTVAAGYAKALLDFAVSKGADQVRLLERADVCLADLVHQDSRLPMARFVSLMRTAKRLCNDPALALDFGASTRINRFSIVGLISHASATMGEAFEQTNRYGQLVIEVERPGAGRFKLVRDDAGLWMEDQRLHPNRFPELTESTFARFVGEYRRAFGKQFARLVHVTHPEPAHRDDYGRVLGTPVVFDSHRNAMLIDDGWPDIRIGEGNGYVFGILSDHAQALLDCLEGAKTVRGRVEACVIPELHKGEVNMTLIAGELGMSRQTLYRKLKAEGVSFEKLLDELRHQMALHYLNGRKVSATEAAYLVGFSDPSSFSRAFRRWTGLSPSRRGSG